MHRPRQYPPHDLRCAGATPITVKLARRRWWQFASDGAVAVTFSCGNFQPAVPQIVLAGAGMSDVMLYPGHEVDVSFTGADGVRVLIWSADADDVDGRFTGGLE